MPLADDSEDPWAIPDGLQKNRRSTVEKTRALSLNDKLDLTAGDDKKHPQAFGGFSAPQAFSGVTFGDDLNLRRGYKNRSLRSDNDSCGPDRRYRPFNDGSSDQPKPLNGSSDRAGRFNDRGGDRLFNPSLRVFGSFAQGRTTFGGGLPTPISTDSPFGGFRAPDPIAGTTSLFKRNLLSENRNNTNMGGFAPPGVCNFERVQQSLKSAQFGNERREDCGEVEQRPEAEADNNSFGGFANAPLFFKARNSISSGSGNPVNQANAVFQNPTSSSQGISVEDREKSFWAQAASRSSPFLPFVPAQKAPGFGVFDPCIGRPVLGRGVSGDQRAGISGSVPGFEGAVASFSRPPLKSGSLLEAAKRTAQEGGGGNSIWFPDAEYEKPMPNEEISLLNKILHKKLENLQNGSLEITQARSDPNSPLYSATSFQSLRLKEELLRALEKMGFHMPSKIQEAALPLLLIEPPLNMIAQAQSGTGKTAAFALTMLSRVISENKWPQCLCLAPTYELAMQIGQVVQNMAEFLPEIKIRYAIKGERMARGEKIEEQIVIGTPGKMLDWVLKLKVIDPSKIICLVLDEADVMISQQGHQDQSIRLHNELERSGAKYQSLLFSATYDESVRAFADSIIKDAVNITLRRDEQTLKNIKQYYVKCANREEKYEAVMNLYGGLTIASAIIFCYTRKSAEWLAARMSQRGHDVTVLHGEMTIEERARTIQEFKESVYKVLITTNVCARGIDVCQVSVVINYDPPVTYSDDPQPDYETYIHRIGRTGRFGKAGIAINLVSDDFALSVIKRIGEYFGAAIEPLDASDFDQLEAIEKY